MLPVLSCAPIRGREVSALTSSGMWKSSLNRNHFPASSPHSPAQQATGLRRQMSSLALHFTHPLSFVLFFFPPPFCIWIFCHSDKRKWEKITHRDVYRSCYLQPFRSRLCDKIARERERCIASIQVLATHSVLPTASKHNRAVTFIVSVPIWKHIRLQNWYFSKFLWLHINSRLHLLNFLSLSQPHWHLMA